MPPASESSRCVGDAGCRPEAREQSRRRGPLFVAGRQLVDRGLAAGEDRRAASVGGVGIRAELLDDGVELVGRFVELRADEPHIAEREPRINVVGPGQRCGAGVAQRGIELADEAVSGAQAQVELDGRVDVAKQFQRGACGRPRFDSASVADQRFGLSEQRRRLQPGAPRAPRRCSPSCACVDAAQSPWAARSSRRLGTVSP